MEVVRITYVIVYLQSYKVCPTAIYVAVHFVCVVSYEVRYKLCNSTVHMHRRIEATESAYVEYSSV